MQFRFLTSVFFMFVEVTLAVSCGENQSNLPTFRAESQNDNAEVKKNAMYAEVDGILILEPAPNHYSKQLQAKMKLAQDNIAEMPTLIYLNFNGAILGNEYFGSVGLTCAKKIQIPPSGLTLAEIEALKVDLESHYDYSVKFTTDEPSYTTFSAIHYGGSSRLLDCDNLPDSSAVAAKDPGNLFSNDVAHVFESPYAATLSHSIAVIDAITGVGGFEFSTDDQLSVDQVQRYTNIDLALQELSPSDLVSLVPLQPQVEAVVPEDLRPLPGLDKVVTVLAIAGNDDGRLNISKAKNILGTIVSAPSGILLQIAKASGAAEVSIAVELAKLLFGDQRSESEVRSLPSFDDFLELNTSSYTLTELIRKFETHNLFLEMNYKGKPEVRTLAILAFLQALPKASNG